MIKGKRFKKIWFASLISSYKKLYKQLFFLFPVYEKEGR